MSGYYHNQPPNGSPPRARQPGQGVPMSPIEQHNTRVRDNGRQNASLAAPYAQQQPTPLVPSAHAYQPTAYPQYQLPQQIPSAHAFQPMGYPQQGQPNAYSTGLNVGAYGQQQGWSQQQQAYNTAQGVYGNNHQLQGAQGYPAQYQGYPPFSQGQQNGAQQLPMAGQGWRPQDQQVNHQPGYQTNGYGYGASAVDQRPPTPYVPVHQGADYQGGQNVATNGHGGMYTPVPTPPPPPPPPPMFNNDGTPTPYAIRMSIQSSATGADNRVARFPLQITAQGPFIAPLPFITEQERQLQQTTRDVDALGQLYIVEAMNIYQNALPFGEGQDVLTTRIDLGRFGHPHWQTYPANTTFPARSNQHGGAPLTLQPWLPPHAMPRHPALAYWGRDLSAASGRPLPNMRAYVASQQGQDQGQGQVEQRPLFVRATDGDGTDRGWGPGVQVHDDQQPGLQRATMHLQQLVLEREAARWAEEHEVQGRSQE